MNFDDTNVVNGKFFQSLKRNNKQIRDDRAASIVEDTEMAYKRSIEDLQTSIKKMVREQENMLDLSPTNATNLTLASDFDVHEYVQKDISIAVKIRQQTIQLECAQARYEYLFGAGE